MCKQKQEEQIKEGNFCYKDSPPPVFAIRKNVAVQKVIGKIIIFV